MEKKLMQLDFGKTSNRREGEEIGSFGEGMDALDVIGLENGQASDH